jgi:hypothetical protein
MLHTTPYDHRSSNEEDREKQRATLAMLTGHDGSSEHSETLHQSQSLLHSSSLISTHLHHDDDCAHTLCTEYHESIKASVPFSITYGNQSLISCEGMCKERQTSHMNVPLSTDQGILMEEHLPHDTIYAVASEKRFVPPLLLVGPVLGILCCTAGMATSMLIWIYTHKLPLHSNGVLYLHEGDEEEMDREYTDKTVGIGAMFRINKLSSHPTTLTLSSIIVSLIGSSIYPMMGLIAYGIAADWIQLQERVANSDTDMVEELPTPVQYALMTRLCSSNGFSSVLETFQHWYQIRSSRRARIPTILKKVLAWLIVLLFLQTSIAWLDFLMHETTRTVSVVDFSETTNDLPYSMGLNHDLCPASNVDQYPCLLSAPASPNSTASTAFFAGNDPVVGSEGWLVANKASRDYAVQTYRDVLDRDLDNMSYYTNPAIRTQDYMEKGYSIGLKARCAMLTSRCHATEASFDCTSAGRPELKSEHIVAKPDSLAQTKGYATISDTLYSTDGTEFAQHAKGAYTGPQKNPWTISGLIVNPTPTTVSGSGFQDFQISGINSRSSSYSSYGAFTCNLTFRDMQISYFNETYQIQSWNDSSASLAHDLSGPLLAGLVTNVAFSAVAPVAGRVKEEEFARALEKSLAFNILALSAGLIAKDLVPIRAWRPILAQQYDRSVLFAYIALLYTYALTAIVLFLWAWGTSSSCIVYRDDRDGNSKEIAAVSLAQRRLMEPVGYLIAMHLCDKEYATDDYRYDRDLDMEQNYKQTERSSKNASRTAQTGLLRIIDGEDQEARVVVGLESRGRGFGVWPLSRASAAVSSSSGSKKNDNVLRAHHF